MQNWCQATSSASWICLNAALICFALRFGMALRRNSVSPSRAPDPGLPGSRWHSNSSRLHNAPTRPPSHSLRPIKYLCISESEACGNSSELETNNYPLSPQPAQAVPETLVAPHFPHFVVSAMVLPSNVNVVRSPFETVHLWFYHQSPSHVPNKLRGIRIPSSSRARQRTIALGIGSQLNRKGRG